MLLPPKFLCPDDVVWRREVWNHDEQAIWICESAKRVKRYGIIEEALETVHPEIGHYWITEALFHCYVNIGEPSVN